MNKTLDRRRRLMLGAAVATVFALAMLTACAPSGDASSSAPGASSAGQQSEALQALYAGNFTAAPSTGPAAQQAKKVWWISCGQLYPFCAAGASAFEEAAAVLGWDATVFDGQADPATASLGIEQALAAGVDGIAVSAYDCDTIKGSLQQAQAASVPVVAFLSADCAGQDAGLFTATPNFIDTSSACEFNESLGAYKAEYIEAAGLGSGVINVHEDSQALQNCLTVGFEEKLASCESCTQIDDVAFTFSGLGNLQQLVGSALLKNPSATVINSPANSLVTYAIGPAVKAQGLSGQVKIVSGDYGDPANMELIREGVQTVSINYSVEWTSYGMADALNRIFADGLDADQPDQGNGFQVVDADHNLPAPGANWEPPIDFRAQYTSVWTP